MVKLILIKIKLQDFLLKKKIVNVKIFTKEKIVLCGGKFVKDFISKNFPKIKIKLNYRDGDEINKNSNLILLEGDVRLILKIERTILNFYNTCRQFQVRQKNIVKLKNLIQNYSIPEKQLVD